MSLRTCPRCGGSKRSEAFVDGPRFHGIRLVDCAMCKGAGVVTAWQFEWWQAGQNHYRARVDRGESVRECARRLGISAADLSGMEHGRLDPAPIKDDRP